MSKLPHADQAIIDPRKVTSYLLDAMHPVGGPKAAFFAGCGFRADDPAVLISALLEHGRAHEAIDLPSTVHGAKYAVVGMLRSPDSTNPTIRTIWIIDAGQAVPRFVTAVPA
jgi:hypothetical protein